MNAFSDGGSTPPASTTSEQSPLCSDVFLCLWQKRRHPPAPLLLLSNCDPLRWAHSWCAALRAAFFSILRNIDFNRPAQNERHDFRRAFRFGFRGLWLLHPSEISILGRAKPALRKFFASLRIYAALAARPRRAVGWYSVHSHKAEKIDFNRSLQKEGHDRRSCPSFWIPPPGGRRSSIHLSSSQNFCNITAVWARVARPWGERALSPVPLMIPAFTAQSRASSAQPEIRS